MAHYLVEAAYTPEALAALVKQPQNRIDTAVRPLIEKAGGRVVQGWFAPGTDRHLVFVADLPNAATVAAVSYASTSTGSLASLRITPLVTPDEFTDALRRAPALGYRPPGA